MKYDVIIVGAGLGGLECGYILSRHGRKVCVLERTSQIGGCLQTFRRMGCTFDTGFHYVGALDEGQNLNRLFKYFGLMDLPWKRMDADGFDEVVIGGDRFMFVNGREAFADSMARRFPDQRRNLDEYMTLLKGLGDNLFNSFLPRRSEDFYGMSMFANSAYDYMSRTITDPLLLDVLSGTSLKMELHAEKLPLYVFGQINNSFIESAYRLRGGGMQIAAALRRGIESNGGVVMTGAEVTGAVETDGRLTAVRINGGEEQLEADSFISNAHPAATLAWLDGCKSIRNIYRKRICALPNTFGMFTVNIKLKPNTIKYLNRNIYAYRYADLWHQSHASTDSLLISFPPPAADSDYADTVDLLTPMAWDDVAEWFGTKIAHRGGGYEDLKERKAAECLEMAEEHVPGLRAAVDRYFTSTPLTYHDYTLTQNGSSYGIQKDCNNLMYTMLTPKTPVSNLYLTGQNLNLHGILGVSMTSFFTCSELIGMNTLLKDFND